MFEYLVEYDVNPTIVFTGQGKVFYANQEAEILLSYTSVKEIFNFCIENLSPNKITTKFEDIFFKDFHFKGVSLITYEDKLAVRFFINTETIKIKLDNLEEVDLSTIINFVIEYFSLNQNHNIKIIMDELPTLFVNKNELVNLLLNAITPTSIIEIKIIPGEYMKIKDKKYPIVGIFITPFNEAESQFFEINRYNNNLIIKIPLIKERDENSSS